MNQVNLCALLVHLFHQDLVHLLVHLVHQVQQDHPDHQIHQSQLVHVTRVHPKISFRQLTESCFTNKDSLTVAPVCPSGPANPTTPSTPYQIKSSEL